jgi:hypothetical protein
MSEPTSILEDPTNYISQYSEKTKYSCTLLAISLFLVLLFFVSPFSVSSGSVSSIVMKVIIVGLLVGTSAILFEAVQPVMRTAGVLDTDMFPDLKFNFFITAGFIIFIMILGIVVVRL